MQTLGATHWGRAIFTSVPLVGAARDEGHLQDGLGTPLSFSLSTCWGLPFTQIHGGELCSSHILFIGPCHPIRRERKQKNNTQARASQRSLSEQIRQDEARRFRFNTVDPEIGTAGMVLVSSICQLEAVCFRVECPTPRVHV